MTIERRKPNIVRGVGVIVVFFAGGYATAVYPVAPVLALVILTICMAGGIWWPK